MNNLSQIGLSLNQSSVTVDYEPYLRSICKLEKIREIGERKGSRFYHYLRRLSSFNLNENVKSYDQHSNVFQLDQLEQ